MQKPLLIGMFFFTMPLFSSEGEFLCRGIAEFCQSSEPVSTYVNDLSDACDALYKASSADLVVNVKCKNKSGLIVKTIDRCE